MEKELYLPTLSHWQHGNPWSGSVEHARFAADVRDGEIHAQSWRGPLMRSLSEIADEAVFPVSHDGIEQLRVWLTEQVARLNAQAEG